MFLVNLLTISITNLLSTSNGRSWEGKGGMEEERGKGGVKRRGVNGGKEKGVLWSPKLLKIDPAHFTLIDLLNVSSNDRDSEWHWHQLTYGGKNYNDFPETQLPVF